MSPLSHRDISWVTHQTKASQRSIGTSRACVLMIRYPMPILLHEAFLRNAINTTIFFTHEMFRWNFKDFKTNIRPSTNSPSTTKLPVLANE